MIFGPPYMYGSVTMKRLIALKMASFSSSFAILPKCEIFFYAGEIVENSKFVK